MLKIVSIVSALFGILIGLKYFGIYDAGSLIGMDIALVGSLVLIASQIIYYIAVHASNQGTTLMAKIIKFIIAVPGVLYVISALFAFEVGDWLELVVAIVLVIEGLYGLH